MGLSYETKMKGVVSATDKVVPAYYLVNAAIEVAVPRGANKDKLLRGTGIFLEQLTPESRLSAHQCLTLLANVQSQCNSKDVSFLIGKSLADVWQSPFLRSLGHAKNLNRAIKVLQQYRWHSFPFVSFRRHRVNDSLVWVIENTMGSKKLANFLTEMSLSLLVALIKQWAGRRLDLSCQLEQGRPRNISDYETYLGLNTGFDSPVVTLSMPESSLFYEFPNTRAHVVAVEARVDDFLPQQSLLDLVRFAAITTPSKSQSDVAAELGVSAATLKRSLCDHNTSFRALQEQAKRQQAFILLALQKLNNLQGASRMSVNDLPNFRRTIKRLTGYTPSELRALLP